MRQLQKYLTFREKYTNDKFNYKNAELVSTYETKELFLCNYFDGIKFWQISRNYFVSQRFSQKFGFPFGK